ncbi:MAG: hypothetical protein HFF66_01110 [Oscillospiraceae bacterium]|jgi:flagellar hook-associated protein FlgK|nr:hypothetical protein [Oscillospiraceae bacterium]
MAVLGTFGSFTTARLGIYASQASLNVTGNNIANINTVGYTRQRMDLVSLNSTGTAKYASSFMVDVGYGVLCESTSQLRDPYMDIRFRNEQAAVGKTETWLEGLDQLSHILDEVGRGTDDFGVIADQIHEFFDALQGLQQRVGTDQYDDLVRSAGSTLVKLFNSGAKGLETIRANEFKKLQDSMKKVNSILNNIRDLNKQIRTQGIYGDNALELRDARNVELDKLSKYMKINVTYSMEKIDQYTEVEKMTVSLADSGNPPIVLVDGIYGRQFDMPEQSAMPNPAYDPKDPKGMMYIGKDGKPTDIERLAALKQNPKYNPNSDALKKYVDENGIPTNSLKNAARKENPNWDKDDPTSMRYVKPDGTLTNNRDEAEILANNAQNNKQNPQVVYDPTSTDGMKYLDAQGNATNDPELAAKQLNPDYDATYVKGMKYLKLKDGVNPEDVDYSDPDYINKFFEPTDDPDKAAKVYSFSEDHLEENRYLFQLTDMVDEKGHYMRDKYGVEIKDEPVDVSDTLLYGSIQSLREILTEEGEFSEDYDVALDPNAKTKRGIPYYQKVMDNWAQTFAEVFNAANQMDPAVVYKTVANSPNDNKEDDPANPGTPLVDDCFLDANGKHVTYKDKDGNTVPVKSTKEVTENGVTTTVPKEISDYTADELKALRDSAQLKEEYSFYDGGVLFSNSGDGNDPTGITAKNISIAYDWDKGAVRVLNTKEANTYDASKGEWSSHTTRQDNILHMINLIGEKRGFVASDTVANVNDGGKAFFNGTFEEMFTGISGTLATDRNATTKLYSDHSVTSLNLDNSRASVSGVDLNDEATSMMQFEKSYSAACRLLTTLDSMLDKLINGTAI